MTVSKVPSQSISPTARSDTSEGAVALLVVASSEAPSVSMGSPIKSASFNLPMNPAFFNIKTPAAAMNNTIIALLYFFIHP